MLATTVARDDEKVGEKRKAASQQTQRIKAQLSNEQYSAANQAFLRTWLGDEEPLQCFLKKNAPTTLQSVLSVGSGNGERDVVALKTLMEKCHPTTVVQYTAVEPNQSQMDQCESNMTKAFSKDQVKVTTCVQKGEDYEYGSNKHDVVLFTHSLYHMSGKEKDVITKAVASLKPGGRLVAALSTEKGGIFQLMGQFWSQIDYSHFEEGGLFGQESLLKVLHELQLPYSFLPLPHVYIDVNQMDTPLRNFLMQCDTDKLPAKMVQQIERKVNEAPQGRLPHGSGLVCLFKEEEGKSP